MSEYFTWKRKFYIFIIFMYNTLKYRKQKYQVDKYTMDQ